MNSKIKIGSLVSSLIIATLLLGVGCGTAPKAWNVHLVKKTKASIEVDVIGITEIEKPSWAGYDLNKYWEPGDLRRQQAEKVTFDNLNFDEPSVLKLDDKQWQKWFDHGASQLLVVARLTGQFDPGPADPRRIFIPLSSKDWKAKNNILEIEIYNTLIKVVTPQKPQH